MCLINFQLGEHERYKLIVAANRDEFYERPTARAHFWEDAPYLLAGKDLRGMGTWLGITKEGRFAALTNIRRPEEETAGKRTRGDLVRHFLEGQMDAETYVEQLKSEKDSYAGFNLLVGSADELVYFNNEQATMKKIETGVHGLSNAYLNSPWPKVVKGKQMLHDYTATHREIDPEVLFTMLADAEEAREDLPNTGVDLELEKKLSPLFIRTPHYGTRCSTILLVDQMNQVTFIERTYVQGEKSEEVAFTFTIN